MRSPAAIPIVDAAAESVVSGRTIHEIAEARERVWQSSRSVAANVHAGAVTPARSSKARGTTTAAGAPAAAKKPRAPRRTATADRAADGREAIAGVALSNPDKLYFPEAGITKRDLARYYESVAPWILPHIERRPLSLVRCPDGWSSQCFYQKNADRSVHEAVARVEVPGSDGPATYFSAGSAAALVGLVQWGVIELHPWGARSPRLDRPDRLIFDFDPDEGLSWDALVAAVRELRALLAEMHLVGFLKTTGGKGLHVVLPIRATLTWDEAKSFSRAVADTDGAHDAGPLHDERIEGSAEGEDLHRLSAQRVGRDRGCAVRRSRAGARPCRDADRLVRSEERRPLRPLQHRQRRPASRSAHRSMGGLPGHAPGHHREDAQAARLMPGAARSTQAIEPIS